MPGGGIPEVGLGRPTMAFHGFHPSSLFTEVTSSWCSVTCQNSIVVFFTVFNGRSGPDMYPKFTPTRSPPTLATGRPAIGSRMPVGLHGAHPTARPFSNGDPTEVGETPTTPREPRT